MYNKVKIWIKLLSFIVISCISCLGSAQLIFKFFGLISLLSLLSLIFFIVCYIYLNLSTLKNIINPFNISKKDINLLCEINGANEQYWKNKGLQYTEEVMYRSSNLQKHHLIAFNHNSLAGHGGVGFSKPYVTDLGVDYLKKIGK